MLLAEPGRIALGERAVSVKARPAGVGIGAKRRGCDTRGDIDGSGLAQLDDVRFGDVRVAVARDAKAVSRTGVDER